MDYVAFVNRLAEGLEMRQSNADFVTLVPAVIDAAEQRVYRELDLLSTIIRDSSATLTANSRNFTLPTDLGRFVVTESMNVFTPVGTTTNRNQLVPVSREYLDATWSNEAAITSPSIPQYYAMITDQTIIVGPPPDANYTMEVIGTIRPNPLSASNPTTVLTLYLPDLFVYAALAFAGGYQINRVAPGTAPIDVQQADAWEKDYQAALASAGIEEMRKRYESQGWTPKQPAPIATPPRT